MALSPYTHPEIFKSLIIGALESPGVVTLSGHDRAEEWESQRAKGTTGSTTVNHGRGVMAFTATFFLADNEDRDAWDVLQRFLLSTTSAAGGKPKAIGVYHPDLISQQITDVVVTSIGGMSHDSKGGSTVAVKFLEFRPPRPKPASKANGSASGARQGTTRLDPNAAAKRELAALLDQAKRPL